MNPCPLQLLLFYNFLPNDSFIRWNGKQVNARLYVFQIQNCFLRS